MLTAASQSVCALKPACVCEPSTHWQTYLVFSRVFCIFLVILSMVACFFPSAKRSVLFNTTISFWQAICPITRHSADWVCIPLVTSMTSIIRSMIWAPGRRKDKVRDEKGRGELRKRHNALGQAKPAQLKY